MSRTLFWVGLENAETDPHGHGEDYRVWVEADPDTDEGADKLQAAVLHIAAQMTCPRDGDRIAVRILKSPKD